MQAHNVVVTGGSFTHNNYGETTFQRLYDHVAQDAFHNSQEREGEASLQTVHDIAVQYTQRLSMVSCPSTTIESLPPPSLYNQLVADIINDIFMWLHKICSTDGLTVWVYDDDRRLTSLVAQVVSEVLDKQGRLSAAYFFPRSGLSKSGTDICRVLPTIAYQLAQRIPAVKTHIGETLEADIAILNLKIQKQVEDLVIGPLKRAFETQELLISSNVILVHALEDCEKGDFRIFLDVLMKGLASIRGLPVAQRLLILGRPTSSLREYFSSLSKRTILQRPMRHKDWHAREQDICRREEELRRREEAWAKMSDDPEASCKEIRALVEEDFKLAQRERILREQEKKVAEGFERLKRKEAKIIEKSKQKEKKLERKMQEILEREQEIKKVELKLKEDATKKSTSPFTLTNLITYVSSHGKPKIIALIGQTDINFTTYLTQNTTWKRLESGLHDVRAVEIDNPNRPGSSIVLIDAPSYNGNADQSPARIDILYMVNNWLHDRYGRGVELNGILYHHPMRVCYSDAQGEAVKDFKDLCRDMTWIKMTANVLVITVEWNTELHNEARRQQMEVRFQHWKAGLESIGARVDRFDNTATTAWRLVERLLTKR